MVANSSEFQEELQKLEQKHADNPDGRYFVPLATAYRKAGEVDRAIELLREGLQGNRDYLSAHIVLGRCLADKGDDAAAREEFDYVLQLDPQNLVALRSLGEMATAAGDYGAARHRWEELLGVDPMNEDARRALEKLDSAPVHTPPAPLPEPPADHLDTVAPADEPLPGPVPTPSWEEDEPSFESPRPDNAVVTETIAELYTRQGFYDRAIEVYRELLRRRGPDAELEERLARVERLLAGSGGSPASPSQVQEPPVEAPSALEAEALEPAPVAEETFAPAPQDHYNDSADSDDLVIEGYSATGLDANRVAPAEEEGTIGDLLTAVLSWTPGSHTSAPPAADPAPAAITEPAPPAVAETPNFAPISESPVEPTGTEAMPGLERSGTDDDLGITEGLGLVEGFDSDRFGWGEQEGGTSSVPPAPAAEPDAPKDEPSRTPFGDDDLGLEPPLSEQVHASHAPTESHEPEAPQSTGGDASNDESEDLNDEDLESFQEWLRSLKR